MSLLADLVQIAGRRSRKGVGWVGVDIGTAALKLAQVEQRGRTFRLVRSAVIPRRPRPDSTTSPDSLTEAAWFGDPLRQHFAGGSPLSGRTAACALSMSATPLRVLDLPPGKPEDLREIAALELSDSNGGRPNSVGCWPAPAGTKEGLVPVYALSVDEELAVNVAEGLWGAGLRTHLLDGAPHALARGVKLAAPDEAHVPSGALDWGDSTATFVVAIDGKPVFARVLRDSGLRPLIETAAKSFDLPVDDAERLLVEIGLPGGVRCSTNAAALQETVRDIAADYLNRVCDEVGRTFDYLASQCRTILPQRVWLFGGGATIANVAPFLTATCGVPCEAWRLPGTDPTRVGLMPLFGIASALSILGCRE